MPGQYLQESLLLVFCLIQLPVQAEPVVNETSPPGQLISLNGYQLHLYCTGEGSPTVLMDAGLGGNSLEWSRVQPALASHTRVCTYDRAGYGWSDPGPLPRTSKHITEDLYHLLQQARISSPYVLVGHSFGGINMRLFASQYPKLVHGLVLIDAAHEQQIKRFSKELHINTAPTGSTIMLRSQLNVPKNMPAKLHTLAMRLTVSHKAYAALHSEMISMRTSSSQLLEAMPLPDIPLVVITRGKQSWGDDKVSQRKETLWQTLQHELPLLTTQHAHLIASDSGHHIHLDAPEIVIDAIRSTTDAARDRAMTDRIFRRLEKRWQLNVSGQ